VVISKSWVKAGWLVMMIEPRGIPEEPVSVARPSMLGDTSMAMRAGVVGKNLVGMRAEDIIRGVDYLRLAIRCHQRKDPGFGARHLWGAAAPCSASR